MPLAHVTRRRSGGRWCATRLPYSAAIAVNTLYFRVTIIVMSLIAAAAETGYFATSFRVIEVLIGVPGLAIGAAFPILARAAGEDRQRLRPRLRADHRAGAARRRRPGSCRRAQRTVRHQGARGPRGAPAVPVLQIQALALFATFLAVATSFPLLSLRRHSRCWSPTAQRSW